MPTSGFTIEKLWEAEHFEPTKEQEKAIRHVTGPLYLTAGPGSGKTRVLLWRTLNLIVFHQVPPEEIFLSTFTEKAALQLREGLRGLLGVATLFNGKHYDISKMYVGTVHSLCQQLLADRRFSPERARPTTPILMDELSQYLYLYRRRRWAELLETAKVDHSANQMINEFFGEGFSNSRHRAVTHCISLFNRLSEECIDPEQAKKRTRDQSLRKLLDLYAAYKSSLLDSVPAFTDFALLQQLALAKLEDLDRQAHSKVSGHVFRYIIIDEYQDTNTVQEQLFFRLAAGHKNLCIVGDDDQALYRFRGATVENFVEFKRRCRRHLGLVPEEISLSRNFRSRRQIVDFYKDFINHESCDWRKPGKREELCRVPKDVTAHRHDEKPAVITSGHDEPDKVCREVAKLVRRLIDEGKVSDPNEIAFLYPSLKSVQVGRMIEALEEENLKVYAPRAKTFLDVPEATAMFGLMLHIFGRPERGNLQGRDYIGFHDWMDKAFSHATQLMQKDKRLARFVDERKAEINVAIRDHKILNKVASQRGWELTEPYKPEVMRRPLIQGAGLSNRASKTLAGRRFDRLVEERERIQRPYTLGYVINRLASLDWNVLDLFYRLTFFKSFSSLFDLISGPERDEGPVWNLSLISQYLAYFMDEYNLNVLTGMFLSDHRFERIFFSSYLFALYRRGESEYEDAEDPFPRGRIPFLTIHQAKGLEFPVVILGNPGKIERLQQVEKIVHPLLDPDREKEPMDRMAQFDVMRMFYVALSRAKNLLVIARYKGGHVQDAFKDLIDDELTHIREFDFGDLPNPEPKKDDLPKNYSYTGDYLLYKRCPRQYMFFRKYQFAPARTQTMFFGNLVHQTIEDLHQHLIREREASHA